MGKQFAKLKDENKILVMLAFFSLSIGLWNNFKQLWLQDNSLDVTQISQILSIAGFACAIAFLIFSKKIKLSKIRNVIAIILFGKTVNSIILYMLNGTGNTTLINLLIVLDLLYEKAMTICIYPFIITIKKENQLYSKRKLVEYLFSDIGILIGGMCIGQVIAGTLVDYNICLLISTTFLALAFLISSLIQQPEVEEKETDPKKGLQFFMTDKINRVYFGYLFVGNIAMNTALGLKMLMLTKGFQFADNMATNYLLIIGLLADLIGIFALKYMTPKNNYVTITLKFGIRCWFYLIAFFTNSLANCLIAMTWSILISTAYENIVEAPYVNRIPNEYQVLFTNYRYITQIIGTSIGIYIGGLLFPLGIPYMLGLSAFFMFFQIGFSYYLVYLRQKEN